MKKIFFINLLMCVFLLTFVQLAGANFIGEYTIVDHYDSNISNGVTVGKRTTDVRIGYSSQPGFRTVIWDEGTGPVTLPDYQLFTPNRLEQPVRNADWGFSISIDSLFISNGNHMAAALINQEKSDPLDICFSVASWQRNAPTPGIWQGPWNATYYSDPNLTDTANGFAETFYSGINPFTFVDANTVLYSWNSNQLTLQLNGNTAYLPAPINTGTSLLHALNVSLDDTGFSFFSVASDLNDPTVVSVTIGYGTPVPIPGAIWLLGSSLISLICFRKKLKKYH